ncbi:MAG: extracellular solute-binding protein [Eubacteriales bacterium]|jgi:hypothetical protein
MKRFLCFVLAVMLLLVTVACAKQSEDEDETGTTTAAPESTTEPEEPEFKAFDTVERVDYNGYTFHILYPHFDQCYTDFYATGLTGSITNDAIFERNLMVQEAFGIEIDIKWQSYTQVNTDLQTQVKTGLTDYDMYGGHRTSLALSYGGYLYDFSDMSAINLESEWWDPAWVKTMSYDGSIYTLVGDISISSLLFVSSLCFNKQLFDNNNLEYPYELVRNKKWTYDVLYNLIKDYGSDLNGDGKMTYDEDRYGIVGWGTEAGYSLFYASGFTFVSKTRDDKFEINFNAERLTSIMNRVFEIWTTSGSYFNNSGSTAEHPYPFSIFTDDRALFCDSVLSKIGTFITGMESDYGILPQPMFDEYQESYYSYTGYTIPVTMVPTNCPDPDRTGRIIEAFCTASYDEVTPDMYEIVTSVKNARDAESSEMIQIIIRNKFFDPAHWFVLQGYGTLPREIIASGNNNVTSRLKVIQKVAQNNLDTITDAFEKLK